MQNGHNQHVCFIPNIFFNSSYQPEGEWVERKHFSCSRGGKMHFVIMAHTSYAYRNNINMHLRPRASHLQLPQWCCRTAEVKESSRKGKELCVPESTEHNSTVLIHSMLCDS